jgi:type II secretory pathway component GspD/PulD (secretin)
MGGGMGGGMSGGMGGGGMVGNWQSKYRGMELIYTIVQTVEPTSWDPELSDVGEGEGRIMQFGDNQLIIWQTPPIHEKIRKFLDELGKTLGQQIAIEGRFLLVDENYLKDVGLDVDINRFRIGGVHSIMHAIPSGEQGVITGVDSNYDSISLVAPASTKIRSSLGGATSSTQAMKMDFAYGGTMDDLQVDFMIKATQIHQNARQLTAPKAMVLSGESATLEVSTTKSVRTDSTLGSEVIAAGDNPITYYTIEDEYEDFSSGVRLSITPTILDKKYVLLRISTYLEDVDIGEGEILGLGVDTEGNPITRTIYFPTTDLSSIQTRVSVPDRGTVLLGGQTLTSSRQKEAGVPILSKVPLLGRFFSNSSDVQDKRILLILVKPTIVLKEEAEEDAIAAMGGS